MATVAAVNPTPANGAPSNAHDMVAGIMAEQGFTMVNGTWTKTSPADEKPAAAEKPVLVSKGKGGKVLHEAKDLEAEIARLTAENEALRAKKASAGQLSLKVSEKGALSVYGLMRFPVTLYVEQWERLAAHMDQVKAFIAANSSKLARKTDQ